MIGNSHSSIPETLDPADQAEVQQFDRVIEQERRGKNASRATAKELKYMLFGAIFLMLPLVICYLALARGQARIVSTYIAIVAVVVSGWGVFRSLRAEKTAKPRGVGLLYALVFQMLFLFYGTMLLSFTYVLDPETGKVMQKPTLVRP